MNWGSRVARGRALLLCCAVLHCAVQLCSCAMLLYAELCCAIELPVAQPGVGRHLTSRRPSHSQPAAGPCWIRPTSAVGSPRLEAARQPTNFIPFFSAPVTD